MDDLAMLLVCLIWGANFTVSKLAFAELPPLAFTAIRFVVASALLALIVRPRKLPPQLGRILWLGFVGNTLYQLGYVLGLAHSTATNTSLIVAAVPAVVALVGKERIGVRGGVGVALGVTGVVLIVLTRAGAAVHASAADLFTVGALGAWSIYTLGLRSLPGLSALEITTWTTIAGTPGLVLAGIPQLVATDLRHVSPGAWGGLAYSIVLSLIVGYVLWNRSVKNVGATRTTIYMCVTPVVALLIAWAAMGERPTWLHFVGGAIIFAGVVLTRARRA